MKAKRRNMPMPSLSRPRLANRPIEAAADAPTVDEAVLRAAVAERALLTNDLTLGRRAPQSGSSVAPHRRSLRPAPPHERVHQE